MTLIHYSAAPLGEIHSVSQQRETFKPRGLWVSVEGDQDWKQFCESNDFGLRRMAYEQQITLAPCARILRLTSAAEIDEFTAEFAIRPYMVRWTAVSSLYQGIIIAPYIWERRLHDEFGWYYSWDCASGCIWDAAAIRAVVLRKRHAEALTV